MRQLSIVFVAALFCLACSPAAPDGENSMLSGERQEVGQQVDPLVESPEGPASSPLVEFLKEAEVLDNDPLPLGPLPSGSESLVVIQEALDEASACMAEEGFDWLPPRIEIFTNSTDEPEGSVEWTRAYGFGITTLAFSERQVGPDLLGREDDADGLDELETQNEAYEASLTPEELDAYYYALHGEDMGNPDPPGSSAVDCLDRAWYEHVRVDQDAVQEFKLYFQGKIHDIELQIDADERLLSYEEEVRDCMLASGFSDFIDISTSRSAFGDSLMSIQASVSSRDPLSNMDEAELVEMSDAEIEDLLGSGPPTLSGAERSELDALQAEELALAGALVDCGGIPGVRNLRQTLRVEYEQAFLADNELAILAYIEENQKS